MGGWGPVGHDTKTYPHLRHVHFWREVGLAANQELHSFWTATGGRERETLHALSHNRKWDKARNRMDTPSHSVSYPMRQITNTEKERKKEKEQQTKKSVWYSCQTPSPHTTSTQSHEQRPLLRMCREPPRPTGRLLTPVNMCGLTFTYRLHFQVVLVLERRVGLTKRTAHVSQVMVSHHKSAPP